MRRKTQLAASCSGSSVRGVTSSTTCLVTTVPTPQLAAAAMSAATAVGARRVEVVRVVVNWLDMVMTAPMGDEVGRSERRRRLWRRQLRQLPGSSLSQQS